MRARLEDAGMVPIGNTMAQFSALIKRELTENAKLVKAIGLKPE